MRSGSLEVTLVSASIAPYIPFENEPCDTYAILRCNKDQRCTKKARDQGRLPVWNETFAFDLQEQDMSNGLLIQVFDVRNEVDELLGLTRIPIHTMVGKEEATLCALLSPTQKEIGKLKAAWKWKPGSERSFKASSFQNPSSKVEDFTGRKSFTSEPFNPDVPYNSAKATSYKGEESGFAEDGSYTAGAYGSKVSDYGGDSGMPRYPHVLYPNKTSSDPYSKLDAVSDALAKLAVDKEGSGRSSGRSSYSGDSFKLSKEADVPGADHYHQPLASHGDYPSELSSYGEYRDLKASHESRGDFGAYSSTAIHARGVSDHHSYSPSPPANAYPVQNEGYHPTAYPAQNEGYPPYSGSTYPPPSDAYPPNKDTYPSYSAAAYPPSAPTDSFPQDKDRYPPHPGAQYLPPSSHTFPDSKDGYPSYPGLAYPPPPSDAYMPTSVAYPPNKDTYPPQNPTYPSYPDYSTSSTGMHGEGSPYTEKGGGSKEKGGSKKEKEKGGSKKEKEKGHGSHAPHGQPPPSGYQYPPAPGGYPPAPQGYPPAPHGYPPVQYGSSPASQGYPPAPHGNYPPAPHGYPSASQGYSSHGYPPHAAPYGYPSSAYDSHSGKHGYGSGHAAAAGGGAYVGHSSSVSKPSKKHKEPKHSSDKHDKHKKQKSFKGLKFKKFKF